MKVKVKFEAESGADLRNQMLDFLGVNTSPIIVKTDTTAKLMEIAKAQFDKEPEPPIEEEIKVETAPATRKRRSKAEIEADKAAAENIDVPDETPAPDETPTPEPTPIPEPASTGITKDVLTPIVVAKGREGKRADVLALFAEFGAETLPTLDPIHYEAFHAKVILL